MKADPYSNIVNRYAKTWQLLLQYDEDNLPPPNTRQISSKELGT